MDTTIHEADMKKEAVRDEPTPEQKRLGILPARKGRQPIGGLEAFLRSLPRFQPDEAERLRQAITESRAERRRAADQK